MKHFNETELQYELKTYIQTRLKEFHSKLDKEKQTKNDENLKFKILLTDQYK